MAQYELKGVNPDGRIERPTDHDARPEDCDCGDWNAVAGLACWPCFRDGHQYPNPDADADTDEEETSI